LVYDFAHQNNIPHRFNNETKLSGDTSVGRLMAFNKVNVDLFFNTLKISNLV